MSTWIALALWALAAGALSLRERRRLVLAARAGHEIRGPLCAARLALHGLERSARVEAIDLELRRAALALDDLAALGRGRRARLAIDDLAALARGRRAALGGMDRRRAALGDLAGVDRRRNDDRLEVVDVGRLLREAAPAWEALAAAHGGALALEPSPAFVVADPLRLMQACANLVANALEHGGGDVRVRATTTDQSVRIEITDRGPGLPAPVAELVAAARGRRTARGHGLAIAASIAEGLGGRLSSAPSASGARLVLDLPPAPPQPPSRTRRRTTDRPLPPAPGDRGSLPAMLDPRRSAPAPAPDRRRP